MGECFRRGGYRSVKIPRVSHAYDYSLRGAACLRVPVYLNDAHDDRVGIKR